MWFLKKYLLRKYKRDDTQLSQIQVSVLEVALDTEAVIAVTSVEIYSAKCAVIPHSQFICNPGGVNLVIHAHDVCIFGE